MIKHVVVASFVLTLFGCSEPEPPPAPPEPVKEAPVVKETKPKPKPRPKLSPAIPKTKLGTYPVPADLEKEADKTVVVDNFDAELARIEAEIER